MQPYEVNHVCVLGVGLELLQAFRRRTRRPHLLQLRGLGRLRCRRLAALARALRRRRARAAGLALAAGLKEVALDAAAALFLLFRRRLVLGLRCALRPCLERKSTGREKSMSDEKANCDKR